MFGRLFRRDREAGRIASALYGAIVAQARTPALYTDFAVADTVTGRFEMVVLHLVLVLDRLAGEPTAAPLGQAIFDLYSRDMDRSLRELGIGDLGVPKRMKKMTEAFYGRAAVYRAALAAGDRAGLASAIARNVFAGGPPYGAGEGLADYALASARSLAATPLSELRAARPAFAALAVAEEAGA